MDCEKLLTMLKRNFQYSIGDVAERFAAETPSARCVFQYSIGDAYAPVAKGEMITWDFQYSIGDAQLCQTSRARLATSRLSILHWRCRSSRGGAQAQAGAPFNTPLEMQKDIVDEIEERVKETFNTPLEMRPSVTLSGAPTR